MVLGTCLEIMEAALANDKFLNNLNNLQLLRKYLKKKYYKLKYFLNTPPLFFH